MKSRSVVILLAVFVGLCLAYWLLLLNDQRVAQRALDAKKLFAFAPEEVSTVTIEREGEKATTGERREQGGWTISAPYNVPANPVVWERVAKNLAELLNERTIEETLPDDLKDYGLAEPVLEVTAKTKDGESVSLSFGLMEPTQKNRYSLLEGGPLFLVSKKQYFELDRDLLWLRDRDLVKKGSQGISRIEYSRMARADDAAADATGPDTWKESITVVAERGDDGTWHVLEPEPAVADQDTLNKLASEIQFAVGREYVDNPESLADYQLDPPKARIRVKTDARDDMQTFYAGDFSTGDDTEGGVFVMREGLPSVFVVDAEMVTLFPKTPTAWHEKRLITRPGKSITALEYWAGEQHFKLESGKDVPWHLTEPREEESDQGAVSQFIGTLLNMKGANYWPEAKPEFGLDDPIIRIRVSFGDEEEPREIRVGALTEDESSRYVTQGTGDVITLTNEQVKKLVVVSTDFAAKGMLQFRPEDVDEVSLIFEGTSYLFKRGETAWLVAAPESKVWESQSDMRALLDALSDMRAVSVETSPAPADVTPYGLNAPVLIARLTARQTDANNKPIIVGPVTIGSLCKDNPHERYAMAAGRLDLFRVKQDVIDAVRDALRGVVDNTTPK